MEPILTGRVILMMNARSFSGYRVEAWSLQGSGARPVTVAAVARGGGFLLTLTRMMQAQIKEAGGVELRLMRHGTPVRLAEPVFWKPGESGSDLVLRPTLDADGADVAMQRVVHGRVTGARGQGLQGLIVQAFDQGLRAETPLGETRTGPKGAYAIAYDLRKSAGKTAADLILRVRDAAGDALLHDGVEAGVIFDAPADLKLDIMLDATPVLAGSEYDALMERLRPVLDGLSPAELAEDGKRRDITHLARDSRTEAARIEALVLAHRIATEIDSDPGLIYGWLRNGTLLAGPIDGLLPGRPALSVGDAPERLIAHAAGTPPERLTTAAQAAAERGVISAKSLKALPKTLERLKSVQGKLPTPEEAARRDLDLLVGQLFQPKTAAAIQALLAAPAKDLPGIFAGLTSGALLPELGKRSGDRPRRPGSRGPATALGSTVRLDSVAEAAGLTGRSAIKGLAALPRPALGESLRKLFPDLPERALAAEAGQLHRRLGRSHPTARFTAELQSAGFVTDPGRAAKVLARHKDFDLRTTNLDLIFAGDGLEKPADRALLAELKVAQRLSRLAPDLDRAAALKAAGIGSAGDIVRQGRSRFLNETAPKAGLTKAEARATLARAESSHSAALVLAGEMRGLGVPAAAVQSGLGPMAIKSLSMQKFPNISGLFGPAGGCTCGHCRSVFSPAAYLVELLEFLGQRAMLDVSVSPPVSVNMAREELFARRPELADIDLDCANAETPLPYIDLVCEVLEAEIAPDAGVAFTGALTAPAVAPAALVTALAALDWPIGPAAILQPGEVAGTLILRDNGLTAKLVNQGGNDWRVFRLRQTHGSPAERAAAPEYVNVAAYAALKTARTAFVLPFDLDLAEVVAYLDRFGQSRPAMMRALATAAGPTPATMAAADLGLSEAQRALIVTPAANAAAQAAVWALPAASVVANMTVVETFLAKTGLTYAELDLLLQLGFIDPGGAHFIRHLDLGCDLAQKEVAGLDLALLDRVHRFLRLHRALGWPMEVLDAALTDPAIGAGVLNDLALIRLARLAVIARDRGLAVDHLVSGFGRIAHQPFTGEEPPLPAYHRLFLDAARLGSVVPGLAVEAVAAGGSTLSGLAAELGAILRVKSADFSTLIADLTPDDVLSFANLSRLTLAAALCARVRITPAELTILRARSAQDPFLNPEGLEGFLTALDRARLGPVQVKDQPFMLEHDGDAVATAALTDDRATEILATLQAALQAAFEATRAADLSGLTADEMAPALKEALLWLPGMAEADANAVLRMAAANWTTPPDPAAATEIARILGPHFDTAAVVAGQAAIVAAATPAAVETARSAFAQGLVSSVAMVRQAAARTEALATTLGAAFRVEPEVLEGVLAAARLGQPAPGTALLADILGSDALIDRLGNPAAPPAITAAAFPDAFRALRLLHKVLPLAAALSLSPDDLDFVLRNASALGWAALDGLPYEPGQAAVPAAAWERLSRGLRLFTAWPALPDPADATRSITLAGTLALVLPGTATTRAVWLDALAALTGEARDLLDGIDAHFGWSAVNLTAWRDPATWETLAGALTIARTLGLGAAEIISAARAVPLATDAATLRNALSARYSEATWLTTLTEITNVLRRQKRDALVAHLLAIRPEFATPTDLFDHFLIDVEMEAKVASSRIVQAHGTIQTFIERSRMGLEPTAAADTSDSGWEQWVWLRNYRVWEANRKVFVWPENWIEPELLDTKSAEFVGLEEMLLQNELTEDSAEDAFARYLERLDSIAFLEVVASFYQTDPGIMHVFARSKGGDPASYYYRRFEKERSWTPWSKVELDIASDNLVAFMRNGRLNLAWPVIAEETDPDAEVTTPGVSESPSSGPMQQPSSRLQIKLAVSEIVGETWKPKRVSQDFVVWPPNYTTDRWALDRTRLNMLYIDLSDQVWILTTNIDNDEHYHKMVGGFDIAGCRGYPEPLPPTSAGLPDFYPDVKDTFFRKQRYVEAGIDKEETLALRNVLTPYDFVNRLEKTPGTFRVTHPHQFTMLDLIFVLLQIALLRGAGVTSAVMHRHVKLSLGAWLPYFVEDSNRAYVVVPGLYARRQQGDERRTASDFFQFLRDLIALFQKYLAIMTATPAPNPADVEAQFFADPDYLHLADEWQIWMTLQPGEDFRNLYHPLLCPLRRTLYQDGVGAMMERDSQRQVTTFDFATTYVPNAAIVKQPFPFEDVDFTPEGGYSPYNWELFFHAPLMIARRLAREQRFEEAMTWFHRIFNPTGTLPGTVPQKYWVTKPFFETSAADYAAQRIDALMTNLADPASPERHELEVAVAEWRRRPFRPHVVARFRTTAYQRTVVMNYIGTLIDWGDMLFRQDTMESVTQAIQLYVLAEKLLGPKPVVVPPPVETTAMTYGQLRADLDAFGNALVDLENVIPDLSVLPEDGDELPAAPAALSTLYFCIPVNETMLAYWDTVADRLFKIRNSQNIDGVERLLSLFAPPIDPGALVRAVAGGMSLGAALAGLSSPLPAYRFRVIVGKAADFANEVRSLGQGLLAALESRDAQALALLRADLEVALLKAQRGLKLTAIESAKAEIVVLERALEVTSERQAFYDGFEKINAKEQLNLDKLSEAQDFQDAAQIARALGAVLGIIPDFTAGGHGAGGSPAIHATFGGSTLARVADAAGAVLSMLSGRASFEASRAATFGSFDRRMDDAGLQARLAGREKTQIEAQIEAAKLRLELAEQDLKQHDIQTDHSTRLHATMAAQYTNTQLYQWMITEISKTYYAAYKLAHDCARKAERCFNHELGRSDSLIAFGYWNSQKKGLLAANGLLNDIRRMEMRYIELNKREYELTKHVSLRRLDPLALSQLKATGSCTFEVPEALFDLDHPGHYFRRLRSVAVSVPCVAGPYASVSARLSLVSNRYRASTASAPGAATPKEEYEEAAGNDSRFVYNVGVTQSIATSSGQNDPGLFELDFRDERYLPFEGTGAAGTWRLELPAGIRQFDYSTISDVVLHLRYTAREGGSVLRGLAEASLAEKLGEIAQGLSRSGLHVVTDLRRDAHDAWYALTTTGSANLTIGTEALPYFARDLAVSVGPVTFLAAVDGNPASFPLAVDGANLGLNFTASMAMNLNDSAVPQLGQPFTLTLAAGDRGKVKDLALVAKVNFA